MSSDPDLHTPALEGRRRRARRGLVVAGLVVALGAGLLGLRWYQRQTHTRAIETFAADTREATLALERCVVEDAAPTEYREVLIQGLLLDRALQPRLPGCVDAYEQAVRAHKAALVEANVEGAEALDIDRPWELFNPGVFDTCRLFVSIRGERAMALEELRVTPDPLPEIDCPIEVQPSPLALEIDTEPQGVAWRLERVLPSGAVLAVDSALQPRYHAHVVPGGTSTVVDLHPAAILGEPELADDAVELVHVQWDPPGLVALLHRVEGEQPVIVATRPADADAFYTRTISTAPPHRAWLTEPRWFFLGIERGPGKDIQGMGLHTSDDQGQSFRSLDLALPLLQTITAHPEPDSLLLLGTADRQGHTGREPGDRAGRLVVVRVSADAEPSVHSLDYEGPPFTQFLACASDSGAFALVAGRWLFHVPPQGAPRLAHELPEPQRLRQWATDLTCHEDRVVILARRAQEPEPNTSPEGHEPKGSPSTPESAGGPLWRIVCDAEGCDEGSQVADWAYEWDVRSTPAGVRVLVAMHLGPEQTLHLVDEPLGGPIERYEVLSAFYSPIHSVVWDGVTFGVELLRTTPHRF